MNLDKLKPFINKIFTESLFTSFESNVWNRTNYVEIFKNPSTSELKSCMKGDPEIGVILTDKDVYVWDRELALHVPVLMELKKKGINIRDCLPLLVNFENNPKVYIHVPDSSVNTKWYGSKKIKQFIQSHPFFKLKKVTDVSYFDEDIRGKWEGKYIDNPLTENIDKTHEQAAKFFIYAVWRLMPREDKFSVYQFSLWMDNETHLQKLKQSLVQKLYPNDDDGYDKFWDNDIVPTLEKMEQKKQERLSKKIDANDPLFILKSVVRDKTYEGAKQALFKSHLWGWAYKGGRVTDDDAQRAFERVYRHFMGETAYDESFIKKSPELLSLRVNPNNATETIFIQHHVGYKKDKFPEMVKVWRGTNSPLHSIKPGDFVTFDKDYARAYSRGKYKAIVSAILPSKDLRVYKMDPDDSELIYWPENHQVKKYTGEIPSFKNFWETFH